MDHPYSMNGLTLIQFQYTESSAPLGALYLAYGLKRENIQFDLKIYPKYGLRVDLDKLYSFLAQSRRVLAIGCWSNVLPYLIVVLEKIKRSFPEKIIILGGIGPTEVAEEIMRKFSFIDFVIKGCGILPLPKLIKKIAKKEKVFNDISGLVYRNNQNIISNNYNGFYANSDIYNTLPSYQLEQNHAYAEFNIKTSFGCPYRCTYCQIPSLSGRKVIYRDLNKVIEEIKLIKEIKKNEKFTLVIVDEVFNLNRDRMIDFCNLLHVKKINVSWVCNCRVELMDEELLKIMARSGCIHIYYGIESGSNRILRKIKKGFTIKEAIKMILLSNKYITPIIASFIYLYPFETLEDFRDTLVVKRYLEYRGIYTQLHLLTPIKNSEIYFTYRKNLCLVDSLLNTSHEQVKRMPAECQGLIKNNAGIFYFYYTYNFKNLTEILKIAKQKNLYGSQELAF